MSDRPPQWAEHVLRALLPPDRFESVSGDLLEAYRARIHPAPGTLSADASYIWQVCGFVWRATLVPAVLFGGAVAIRTALDWLVPTADFHSRAVLSTYCGLGILLAAGSLASWRSGSVVSGSLAGAATATLGAGISLASALAFLGSWHDPTTLAAIDASGGLGEALMLPILMIGPGTLVGTMGGVLGATLSRHGPRLR